ncbi:MAG: DUF669 domain-containing protein [Comamonas sp.]|uniref:DUF669 domain-containing protein n=1 Tax=Comamonas sp. TaxID=34028 RepID=UPI003D0D9869
MTNFADLNFKADEVKDDFAILPPGAYFAIITSSEQKVNKAGTGKYLAVVYEVIDGPAKGRKIFSNLNLWNASEAACKIAKIELSKICKALGINAPRDSSELHNKAMKLMVEVTMGTDKQGNAREENKIKEWHPATGAAPALTTSAAPAPANQAQAPAAWNQPATGAVAWAAPGSQ